MLLMRDVPEHPVTYFTVRTLDARCRQLRRRYAARCLEEVQAAADAGFVVVVALQQCDLARVM